MSHDTQVKQEDEALAKRIVDTFKGGSSTSALQTTSPEEDRLRKDIVDALATVRREALKEAVKLVQTMSLIEARHCSIEFTNGAQWALDRAAQSIIAALESSATEKEGMNG